MSVNGPSLSTDNLNRRRLVYHARLSDEAGDSSGSLCADTSRHPDGRLAPAWRRWAYLASWALQALMLALMLSLVSINMIRYFKASNGKELVKYLRSAMQLQLFPRNLSPLDRTMLEAEWTAAGHRGPLPPTYDLTIDGPSVFIYCSTALPFAVMGFLVIAFSSLPSEAAWAPSIYAAKQTASRWLAQPLLPHRYGHTSYGGVSLAEALLYAWSALAQICYLVYTGQRKEAKWRAGDVDEVHNLPTWNHAQFTLNWFAKALGVLFTLQGVFLFVPTGRGSLIHSFLGISYGQAVKWHRWLGWQVVGSVLAHGALMQVMWISSSWGLWLREMFRWQIAHSVCNLAGVIAWLALTGMAFALMPVVRRTYYWIFYHSHLVGAALFIIFSTMHHSANYQWAASGLLMYSIDVAYRVLQTSQPVDISAVVHHGSDIISILVPCEEHLEYKDHSHVWVCVPEISRLCFHPFSVITCPAADPSWNSCIMLQSKITGTWTKALGKLSGVRGRISARLQGPYGGANMEAAEQQHYNSLLFITGGAGLTSALASLQRCAIQRHFAKEGAHASVTLVHCVRHQCELQMLAPLLPYLDVINVRVHYTGTEPLHAAAYTNPRPLRSTSQLPRRTRSSDAGGKEKVVRLRSEPRRLRPLVDSAAQYSAVWVLSFAALFWLMGVPDMWMFRADTTQLGLTTPDKLGGYYRMVVVLLAASLVPLVTLASWRTLSHTLTARAADLRTPAAPENGGMSIPLRSLSPEMSADGGVGDLDLGDFDGIGESASMTAARGCEWDAEVNTVVVRTDFAQAVIRPPVASGHSDIAIAVGRPDLAALATEFPSEGARVVGVWVGGPQAMNSAVKEAFGSRLGRDVSLHLLTAEL